MPTLFKNPPNIEAHIPIIFITQSKADINVFVNTAGNKTTVLLNYGITTSYGNSKSSYLTSTSAYGSSRTTLNLTGLAPGTTYYYKVKATNEYGATEGPEGSFSTLKEGESGINYNSSLTYGTITDVVGNTYKTIRIGTQTWMAENLKTIRFNDGTPISDVRDNLEWSSLTKPAFCWHNNDSVTYKMSNGALYNWFAVKTEKLCPTGWHVPSDLEWTTLIYTLGGNDVAFSKLQETGTTHWFYQNPNATNSSGFTALPCGSRIAASGSTFSQLGINGDWWSSSAFPVTSEYPLPGTWELPLYYFQYQITSIKLKYSSNTNGLSVRCLKD